MLVIVVQVTALEADLMEVTATFLFSNWLQDMKFPRVCAVAASEP